MERDELLSLSDLNMAELYREITRRSPHGAILEEDGLLLYAGSHPSPMIVNGAIRTEPRLAPEQVLERASAFFGARGHGYCVCAAAHADADLERVAVEAGLRAMIELTAMVLDRRLDERAPPSGTVLRRVTDLDGVRDFAEVTAEAFFPDVAAATFVEHRILVAPHIAGFVAYADDVPVSAAMTIVSHRTAGVGFVGTKDAYRRRGLGEAVTRAATNAGFDLGARIASLQASPQADPLYRRMGYVEISRYRLYLAAEGDTAARPGPGR